MGCTLENPTKNKTVQKSKFNTILDGLLEIKDFFFQFPIGFWQLL